MAIPTANSNLIDKGSKRGIFTDSTTDVTFNYVMWPQQIIGGLPFGGFNVSAARKKPNDYKEYFNDINAWSSAFNGLEIYWNQAILPNSTASYMSVATGTEKNALETTGQLLKLIDDHSKGIKDINTLVTTKYSPTNHLHNDRYFSLHGGVHMNVTGAPLAATPGQPLSTDNKTDLNNVTGPGNYFCSRDAHSKFFDNRPDNWGDNAFRLYVSYPITSTVSSTSYYVRQRIENINGSDVYERLLKKAASDTPESWESWRRVGAQLSEFKYQTPTLTIKVGDVVKGASIDAAFTKLEYTSSNNKLTAKVGNTEKTADLSHTHTQYAAASHTHAQYATTATLTNYAPKSTLSNYAPSNHSHAQYSITNHTHGQYATTATLAKYATTAHTHAQYSITNHTHEQYATTATLTNYAPKSTLSNYAPSNHSHAHYSITNHTHGQYATTATLAKYATTAHTHAQYSITNHTHGQYATTATLAKYATTAHTHTQYAAASHTHAQYATTAHTHTQYAAASHTHAQYATTAHNHGTGTTNCVTYWTSSVKIGAVANVTVAGGYLYNSSDIRYKDNIETISDSRLDIIFNGLTAKEYDMKDSGAHKIGFIAQEVETVLPETISKNDAGYYSLDYDGTLAAYCEALKHKIDLQSLEIQELRKRVELLEKKL